MGWDGKWRFFDSMPHPIFPSICVEDGCKCKILTVFIFRDAENIQPDELCLGLSFSLASGQISGCLKVFKPILGKFHAFLKPPKS